MSVQLLDKTRKINKLLHNNNSTKVVFNDICKVMMETLDSNILVISKKGKVLGVSLCPGVEEITELIEDKVGSHVDPLLNDRFLSVLSTKENVNLQTLGFERDDIQQYCAIINPIDIAGERLGTVFMYRKERQYDIEDIIVSEYGTTVVGLEMMRSVNEENAEEARKVHGRVSRINKVLGIELSREQMVKYLESLEMKVGGEGDDLYVTAPTVRQDIEIEEDLIEEVARLYGYDKLPVTIPKGNNEASQSYERDVKDLAREAMCGLGINEIQTYSFVSPKGVDNIRIDEDSWERAFVRILNPLGEDTSVMRTVLTPEMLEVLGRNYARNIESVRAFEIGNTFMVNLIDEKDLPTESDAMSIGFYGKDEDFFTLKGVIVEMLGKLGIKDLEFVAEKEYGTYHPGRCARIMAKEIHYTANGPEEELVELGIMGEVHPDVAEKYGIGVRCYTAELLFNVITEMANLEKSYKQLPKYPATSRDIALVVDEEMAVGDIEKVIKGAGGKLLRDIKLFDVYRGHQLGEDKKSVAFALTYRHDDKTLTDEDVSKVHDKILNALKEKLNVTLRDI